MAKKDVKKKESEYCMAQVGEKLCGKKAYKNEYCRKHYNEFKDLDEHPSGEVRVSLIDDEASLAITAKFTIVEIRMKQDWRWKVKMLVHEILPKTHHDYSIKLTFDDRPYLKTISQLEREISDLGSNPSLLPDVDKRSLKELDEKLAKAKKEMEDMRAACHDIAFVTQTEEIKYKDGDTALLFKVLDSVVQPLNDQKYRLGEYVAILDPIF